MKIILSSLLIFVTTLLAPPVFAAKKVALIIGNADYSVANGRLANPVNDARSITKRLRELGFTVLYKPNLRSREAMEIAVEEFSSQISDADIALFYYSGHGVQRAGENYLMPTQATIRKARQIRHRAMNVSFLMDEMAENTSGLSLVILDACRDDPYPRDKKSLTTRGLARMDAPSGTIIAYATKPGATAADGTGDHSPYTAALLNYLQSHAHQPIDDMLNQVNVAVEDATDNQQSPRLESSAIRGTYCFAECQRDREAVKQRYPLYIKTTPADARVRILNIGPEYQSGMMLKPGQYKVEVSHSGYQMDTSQFGLSADNQVYYVALQQVRTSIPTPSTPVPLPRVTELVRPTPVSTSRLTDPYTGMKFVRVKAGCFQMGSAEGSDQVKPVHQVCISEDYFLGQYEVTQAQWQKVMEDNPSDNQSIFRNTDDYPVEQVSWNDVQKFISKLNQQTGENYRLPTEAEWEYACRSRGKKEYHCGGSDSNSVAWYHGNSGGESHKMGQKQANDLGLYDISGNVWEWVQDWYASDYYQQSSAKDPKGPPSGSRRVARGGSWSTGGCSVCRANAGLDDRSDNVGFRLARKN